jgi:rhodanese-related sulfurtransferase
MPVRTITPAEVADRMMHDPAGRLIDVRTPVEFATVHAEGARSIPLDQLDPRAVMAADDGLAGGPVYVICKSGGRAAKACERFHAAGYTDVLSVAGGTDAWARAGLPVVRGSSGVISLERQVRIGAGLLVVAGVVLGWHVHPAFHWLSALVGGGLVFAGATDWCGMGLLLARMPWNTRGSKGGSRPSVPPSPSPDPDPAARVTTRTG